MKDRGHAVSHKTRILEVNATHPLVRALGALVDKGTAEAEVDEWIELLYEQAVLTEGGALDDPNRFAKRVATLLTAAAEARVASAS